MTGIIVVLKPPGLTSHDVVSRVRRLCSGEKAGHTGTLDPEAVGVLPVCVGRATRLTQYLLDADKEYRAELTLNAESSTDDWTGEISPVKRPVALTVGDVRTALQSFRGEIAQTPPMLSAVKSGGRRLYELYRKGITVDRKPRVVSIHDVRLVHFFPGVEPRALIDLTCSRGTYVRTFAADVGRALHTAAYMSFLVRTRVGPFGLSQAFTLEELSECAPAELRDRLLPARSALAGLAECAVDAAWAQRIRNGVQPGRSLAAICPQAATDGDRIQLIDPEGELVAVAEIRRDGDSVPELLLRQVFDVDRD